jgi:DNA-binding NarL/FixJ family response regulator
MSEVRVLVVDDHEVVRLGLQTALEDVEDINIVGQAATAQEAVAGANRLRPDVVLMDVRLGDEHDQSGIDACRELMSGDTGVKVLMFSSFGERELVLAAIMSGAIGYLTKNVRRSELVDALHTAARGDSLLDPRVVAPVLEQLKSVSQEQVRTTDGGLTAREQEVLSLIAEGITNRQIAERLVISEHTARNHVGNILGKLGFRSRAEAAVYATRLGLTRPEAEAE